MLGPAVHQTRNFAAYLAADRRRRWGALAVATYLGLVIADFAWMWPLFHRRPAHPGRVARPYVVSVLDLSGARG